MNDNNQTQALRLLRRRGGATVEQLTEQLGLPQPKAARGLIDRLRAKGEPIVNVAPHKFRAEAGQEPRGHRRRG
jgi:hypothetical protein